MATEIPLTQGQVALVDDEDAAWLNEWSWCASRCHGGGKFVAARGSRGETVYMHRQIMGLAYGDPRQVDHINFNPLDNRRANLRIVTQTENKRWQRSRGGSSSFVGVTWDKQREKWRAQIQIDGRGINLGRFDTEEAAARARDEYVAGNATGHGLNLTGVA